MNNITLHTRRTCVGWQGYIKVWSDINKINPEKKYTVYSGVTRINENDAIEDAKLLKKEMLLINKGD